MTAVLPGGLARSDLRSAPPAGPAGVGGPACSGPPPPNLGSRCAGGNQLPRCWSRPDQPQVGLSSAQLYKPHHRLTLTDQLDNMPEEKLTTRLRRIRQFICPNHKFEDEVERCPCTRGGFDVKKEGGPAKGCKDILDAIHELEE